MLGNGVLVNVFNLIDNGLPLVAVQRSTDRGVTWSDPVIVDVLFGSAAQGQGVIDPSDGHPVRTGDLLPEVAADPRRGSDDLYIVWQDIRFTLAAPLPYFNDQIVIADSTDGGRTWSDPKRVSENKLTQAFTASVEVNDRGHVAVTYYDFSRRRPIRRHAGHGPLGHDIARRGSDVRAPRAADAACVRHAHRARRERVLRRRLRPA